MRTILYPPTIDWDFLFQRPQQIFRQFSRNGWKVMYCNFKQEVGKEHTQIEENLFICHDWQKLIDDKEFEVDVFFTSFPYYNFLPIKSKIVVWDCLDDFELLDKYEGKMLNVSDLVFTTSDFLYNKQKDKHKNVVICKNACSMDILENKSEIPEDLVAIKDIGKPMILFIGAMADWIDVELLDLISKKYSLVIIGEELGSKCPKESYFLGKKSYEELIKYFKFFEVGIIPFLHNKTTQAASPVKMFEYMLGGLQVVSTDLPECIGYNNVVRVSKNYREFLQNIQLALIYHKKYKDEAIKFGLENTWEKRFAVMECEINKLLKEA